MDNRSLIKNQQLVPEAWILFQTSCNNVFIFLPVNGAGGVNQALQSKEAEPVV